MVMALILVLVLGALAGSIAAYGVASFVHTRTVRTQTAMRASAEAGIRVTLDQMKRHQSLCSDFAAPTTPLTITPNNASIIVTCTGVSGDGQGANGWSVILTGIGANAAYQSLIASGGGHKKIGGSMYMAVPSSNSIDDVTLQNGDLWYPPISPATTCAASAVPVISNLTITPQPPRGYICTDVVYSLLIPTIIPPPVPVTVNPPGRDDLVSNCRVFFPGKYTAPPSLATENYFVSGDYYFEFNGSFQIKQSTVIGGAIDPTLGDRQYLSSPSCANARSNVTVAAAENGYGNTWFMGAGATIDVNTQGQVELFRRLQGSQAMSLVAVPTTAGGYLASTVTMPVNPGDPALISTKAGSNNDMVIHGLIDAPLAQIGFGNVSNSANAQVLGGVVAAGIDMQSSASATGFVIETAGAPVNSKILINSKATVATGSATVQAVVDYRPSRDVVDGVVTNGSSTVTSATALFTAADNGSQISGPGIPAADSSGIPTTITFVNSTTATLSTPATASGSALTLVIQTPQIAINSWRKL
jgi:hypothetical protein